jgi:hypothetical protein
VIAAASHDQRIATAKPRPRLGQLSEAEETVRLVADVLQRVLGEVAQRRPRSVPPLLQPSLQLLGLERIREIDVDDRPVGDPLEESRLRIDQRDPRPGSAARGSGGSRRPTVRR